MDILNQQTDKALISMSVPVSIGMLSTFLFQVIDTYFVGQLGPEALTALSFASTLYFILIGLFIGLAVGVSILVGGAKGQGDEQLAQQVSVIGLLLGVLLTVALSAILMQLLQPIFLSLGAARSIIPKVEDYMIPLLQGLPLLTYGLVAGGTLRATGNVTKPEVIMGIAGVINLVFDYAFIFGKLGMPMMGIKGAAYATVLSWVFVVIGMNYLMIRDRLLKPLFLFKSNFLKLSGSIFQLGLPTIITQIIGPVTIMYLTYLLAQQSQSAVAAFGIAGRVEMLLLIGILGVSTATTPFIAQNAGANKNVRVDQAIAFGGKASTYLGLIVIAILFLAIRSIAGIFSTDAFIIDHTVHYFQIVSISYISYGLYLITTSVYNGLKLPTNSLRITLVKALLITLPLTWIGSYWGTTGIFVGLSVSNFLAGFYSAYEMRQTFKKMNSPLAKVNIWQEYARDFKRLMDRALRKAS